MEYNKKVIGISLVVFVLLAVVGLGVFGYLYYLPKTSTKESSTKAADVIACEPISVVFGEFAQAPTAPVLTSKLNKDSKSSQDICDWSVNGVKSHTSTPVDGKCVFGDQMLEKTGTYLIRLTVEKNKCDLSKSIYLR